MRILLGELQKEKKDIEIWTHPLDNEDSGIYGGIVERVFDDGVLIKEKLSKSEFIKKKLGELEYEEIFIPLKEIIRIII